LNLSIAQNTNEFGFLPWLGPDVFVGSENLDNAWAGGLNNVQSGKIDLNGDEIDDLIVFDRHGDRLLPFIFNPESSINPYQYAPEYRRFFPQIKQWFQLIDYNNDGKPDIFTYTPGGILAFKNIGIDVPSFEQVVDPYITSLQGSIFTNLLVTYVDYPAIQDLDSDGDLDILTFWGLGSYVDLHQNMSMELYGNADSLVFHKVEGCWGRFAENPESNEIYLDTCYQKSDQLNIKSDPKHTGSTFSLIDMNGDGISDLILGDVDYSDPAFLINGGDDFSAVMTNQIFNYPETSPVDLWSFPLVQHIDISNSGKKELLVSPFDPGLVKSAGYNSVWLYEDISSSGAPDFRLVTRSFLQNTMIDMGFGAHPVFADINQDGLTDMVLGNYGFNDSCNLNLNSQLKCYYTGRLHLYLNNGSTVEPSFILADDDFAGASELNLRSLYPAFDDLNGNGSLDMVLGNETGTLWYFQNMALPGQMPEYAAPVNNWQSIDAGSNSTPVFVKLPGDELVSLVIGNADGKLVYYRNSGNAANPQYELISDFFGKVNVTDPQVSYTGHSVPCFFEGKDGELNLLVGSESGMIFHYKNITSASEAAFDLVSRHFMYISEGIRTSPGVIDLDSDGFPDLAIGNYSGGVVLFKGKAPGPIGIQENDKAQTVMSIYPNPAKETFVIEFESSGDWEVRILDIHGKVMKRQKAERISRMQFDSGNLPAGLYFVIAVEKQRAGVFSAQKIVIIR
jgi:hypothetical protein